MIKLLRLFFPYSQRKTTIRMYVVFINQMTHSMKTEIIVRVTTEMLVVIKQS